MRILCDDGNKISAEMMDILRKAASLCVENEGLDPERIEISLTFVSKEEIKRLNSIYRNIDRDTDVLSFPLVVDFEHVEEDEEILLGDVVICKEKAVEQAEEYGHSIRREIVYLFVHSVLHLLGYDHMEEYEKKEMRENEEKVMEALDIRRDT